MSLTVEVQPIAEPVTVEQVKAELRLDTDADDTLIGGYITAARGVAERITNRSVAQKSYLQTFPRFPHFGRKLELYRPPLITVTAVRYLDTDRNWQTWDTADYEVYRNQAPAVIVPALNQIFPVAACIDGVDAVEVHFLAGYRTDLYGSDGPDIPGDLELGIIKLARAFYDEPNLDVNTVKPGDKSVAAGALSLIKGQKFFG